MNLGNDFLELISLLWNLEEFDMWIPREHGSVAYLLDGLSQAEDYQEKYDELYSLAKSKNASEFSMKAVTEIVELSRRDERYSEEDLRDIERLYEHQKKYYERQMTFGVGIVKQKYMPEWFFELFHGYITLEKIKREDSVVEYCRVKENKTKEEAGQIYERLCICPDLLNEFYFYVRNERFKTFYPIEEYQLSAQKLCETLGLTPVESYLYLVFLRTDSEKALKDYETKISEINNKQEVKTLMEENNQVLDEQVDKTEEQVEAVEEVAQEAAEPVQNAALDSAVIEKLTALTEAVGALKECFDDKIATDTHKNELFDNMHRELTRYQNGALEKIVDTIALDVIQLVDTTKGHVRVYEKKEANEENYKRLLRIVKGVAEDLEDILYRQNIESYRVEGHEVDVRRQKIIQTVPTADQSKDNLIAARAADGYEKNGKVLRPERIKIFKYSPEAESNSNENN